MVKGAEARGFRQFLMMARVIEAWASDDPAAPDDLAAAMDDLRAGGTRMLRHWFLSLHGDLLRRLGRPDDARATLEEAVREAEATGESFWLPEAHRLLGDVAVAEGDKEEARRCYQRAVEVADSYGLVPLRQRAEDSLNALS